MAKLYNLARMTTATTGTGTITLGSASAGWLSFSGAGVANGETVTYAIVEGNNREVGRGVYTSSGTTLTRTVLKSTAGGSAITLAGNAIVFITAAAEDFLAGNGPAFHAYGSTATSVSINTWTKITLDAENYDTASCFDSTTNYRFTPNVAGYYQFSFLLTHPSGSLSTNWIPTLYKNGTEFLRGTSPASFTFACGGSGLIFLNGSTDYVELYTYQAYLNPATIGGGAGASAQTFLTGFLARQA